MAARVITTTPTTTVALLATAVSYDPGNTSPIIVLITCNRAFHPLVTRAGTVATVSNAPFIADGHAYVRVNPGETISVIRAAGETDGNIWFTDQRDEG